MMTRTVWLLIGIAAAVLLQAASPAVALQGEPPAGLSSTEALRLGERMYRLGLLPSGEPMKAVLQGDVFADGTMFTCVSCHMSSGLGALEGRVMTLPTNGKKLYNPLPRGQDASGVPPDLLPVLYQAEMRRPAYTDATLAAALRWGVDPAGRFFDAVMPRYFMEDRDLEIMIYYLKNLSVEYSPGVTDTTIRFATIVAEDAAKEKREAMLAALRLYVDSRNGRAEVLMRKRMRPRFVEEMDRAFRRIDLAVWELKGDPGGWRAQLEEYDRAAPVFAVLGGITGGEWEPVHRFCEERRIPCLFSMTDFPVISDSDRYTLYFSRGLSQEAETAARYLGAGSFPRDVPVVQVYRDDREGRTLAKAFRGAWEAAAGPPVEDMVVADRDIADPAYWGRLITDHPGGVFLIWLLEADRVPLEIVAGAEDRPAMIFLSAGIMGDRIHSLPEAVREFTYITYPYRMPDEQRTVFIAVEQWLKAGRVATADPAISSKVHLMGRLLTETLAHMKSDFFRDYLLDQMDMMQDQTIMSAVYPRLSFGPGQRYASKGCYIMQVTEGSNPKLRPLTDWVVH